MIEKRILLVGDGNHQFITNLITWLNKHNQYKFIIDILSFKPILDENKKYYNNIFRINDNNFLYYFIHKIRRIRVYYRFYLYYEIIKKLPNYDFIHFHYIGVDSYFIAKQIKKKKKSKIIFSIWGSDLYRLSSKYEKGFLASTRYANIISFTNEKSLNYFSSRFNWEKNNLKLCRFGLAPLESLKEIKTTKKETKKLLNWNKTKMAITIGYNLQPAQQHVEILNQFNNEKVKKLKDKIQLILPITYGGTPKYKNQLLEKLNQLPFEYTIYDTFLTDEKVALIRQASDVMIQLQLTDQFSGSMQEHLYAHNLVITGSWLPYETMKEHGAWFIEIDKLEELTKIIPDVINNFEKYEQKTNNNSQAITELSSWEKNIQAWIDLYNE